MTIQEFDKMYINRMNPRNTYYCETCNKYYSSKMESNNDTSYIVDEDNEPVECMHENGEVEISKKIYDIHIEECKNINNN